MRASLLCRVAASARDAVVGSAAPAWGGGAGAASAARKPRAAAACKRPQPLPEPRGLAPLRRACAAPAWYSTAVDYLALHTPGGAVTRASARTGTAARAQRERLPVGASRVPECGLVGSELRAFVLQVSHEDDLWLLWRWAALNAALRRCLCADPLE